VAYAVLDELEIDLGWPWRSALQRKLYRL